MEKAQEQARRTVRRIGGLPSPYTDLLLGLWCYSASVYEPQADDFPGRVWHTAAKIADDVKVAAKEGSRDLKRGAGAAKDEAKSVSLALSHPPTGYPNCTASPTCH